MTVVVVSAHLDDAVLSCAGGIPEDSVVVTVFAGVPPAGCAVPAWDRLTGARDSRRRVLDRRQEDERALQVLRVRAVHLPLLDAQYRTADIDADEVVAMLRALLREASQVWLPAGIGSHPDHVVARDVGLEASASMDVLVQLYADLPYSLVYGWPASVTGQPPDPLLDVEAWFDTQLIDAGLEPSRLVRGVRSLDPFALGRKRAAVAEYATQLPALDAQVGGRLTTGDGLGFEMSWTVERMHPPRRSG